MCLVVASEYPFDAAEKAILYCTITYVYCISRIMYSILYVIGTFYRYVVLMSRVSVRITVEYYLCITVFIYGCVVGNTYLICFSYKG